MSQPEPYTMSQITAWRRSIKGATQTKMAEHVGVTKQSIVNWENGRTNPTLPEANKCIEFLQQFEKGVTN